MNFYPCNESADVIIDGVSHKGKLKFRNEYIPFCCPEDIAKAVTDTVGSFQTDGCVSIGGKLIILSRHGSGSARGCYITTLQNNLWSVQQRSVLGLYNRIGVGQKGYCIVDGDVYVSDIHLAYAAVNINKVNDDGTTTRIATTPDQQVYGGYIASFVNSNGDNCIAIANNSYKDRCYYYNLSTQEWTKFTLQLPSDYTVGDIYSSTEENVIFCITSNGNKMYKYDFSSNTYTDISNWGELAGNQDKVGRVSDTNWRIPIICDKKVYHLLECNIAYNWNSGKYWGYRKALFILDENGNVIFVPRFKYGDAVLSVCAHDNCIYFLCDETYLSWYENSSTTNYLRRGKFYKFDPKTCRMYDMSIPHLVIDE